MAWHTKINDTEFPLIDKKLVDSNLASMLIASYDNLVQRCNHSDIKWKCRNPCLLKILPTSCEWHVQCSTFQSHAHYTHITSTHVISKLTQCKEWADLQRKKFQS